MFYWQHFLIHVFKNLRFMKHLQGCELNNAIELVQSEMQKISSNINQPSMNEKTKKQFRNLLDLYGTEVVGLPCGSYTDTYEELNSYLLISPPPIFTISFNSSSSHQQHAKLINPLDWWKANEMEFPHLSKVARVYLSIMSTSIPSEKCFSKSGWISNKRRSCLGENKLSNLVMLSVNRHHLT